MKKASAIDAQLSLKVVRQSGDAKLEELLLKALAMTDRLPLLHREVIGETGEPVGMGPPPSYPTKELMPEENSMPGPSAP